MKRAVLIYGLAGGVLIAALRLAEYRFLVVEHSVEIYGALVASLFAGVGIWLGLTLTRKRDVVVKEILLPAGQPFTVNDAHVRALGITPRELEILPAVTRDHACTVQEPSMSMKKTVLTFGLLSGAVSSAMMLLTVPFIDRIGFDKGEIFGYTTIVLSFLLVFFGVRSYRLKASGASQRAIDAGVRPMQDFKQMYDKPWMNAAITFTEPFPIGLRVTVISAATLRKKAHQRTPSNRE